MAEPRSDEDVRHRRRVRRLVIAGAVVTGLLAVTVAGFAYLWSRSNARPVTLEEARRRFLEEQAGGAEGAAAFTPAEGVYQYEGLGAEELSSPPKSQTEGPGMPGTVAHDGDGCWTFRLDYSTNHWRKWQFCADADGLREMGSRVFQRWDFVVSKIDNLTVMRCRPAGVVIAPGMEAGDEWESECRGESTRIAGTTISNGTHRFVGREEVQVGDDVVQALHFRVDRAISGAQQGTEEFDLWLTEDGLPVHGRQRIVVDSDSPIGNVTYTQQGEFSLVRAPS